MNPAFHDRLPRLFRALLAAGLLTTFTACLKNPGDTGSTGYSGYFFGPGEAEFHSVSSRPDGAFTTHSFCDIRVKSVPATDPALQSADTLYRVEIDSTCWTSSDTTKRTREAGYFVVKRGDTAAYVWDADQQRLDRKAGWPFEVHRRPADGARRAAYGNDSVLAWGRRTGPPSGNGTRTDTLLLEGIGLARSVFSSFRLNLQGANSDSLSLKSWNGVEAPEFTCVFYAPDACPF